MLWKNFGRLIILIVTIQNHNSFMEIFIISICNKKDFFVDKFIDKYRKQINCHFKLNYIDISFNSKKNQKKLYESEGKKALTYVKDDSFLIALDENGEKTSSNKFSSSLQLWKQNFSNLYFFIGGPDGLSENIRNRADLIMSLSDLTYPHQFVKIILSEQLYRAICIMKQHPYHR